MLEGLLEVPEALKLIDLKGPPPLLGPHPCLTPRLLFSHILSMHLVSISNQLEYPNGSKMKPKLSKMEPNWKQNAYKSISNTNSICLSFFIFKGLTCSSRLASHPRARRAFEVASSASHRAASITPQRPIAMVLRTHLAQF